MNVVSATALLDRICAQPELVPDYWNIHEPINLAFHNKDQVINALVPKLTQIASGIFLVRECDPGFLLTISLRLGPVQWTTAHNSISFKFSEKWKGGEQILCRYLPSSVLPRYPDYASIPDVWADQYSDRYSEFRRSYTPKDLIELLAKRQITAPFGPYGCLTDIQWFNYFGRVYVDMIGKDRLMNAGWARVEEIGDGLACYATEEIDDPQEREKRSGIAQALGEFVWSPGCTPDQKRIPDFDFTEQTAALSQKDQTMNQTSSLGRVHFAGLSEKEEAEAVRLLEQAGTDYDRETKELKPKKRK